MDTEYCDKCGFLRDYSEDYCESCALVKENNVMREQLKEAGLIISRQVMYGTWLNSLGLRPVELNAKLHKDYSDWFKDESNYCEPS